MPWGMSCWPAWRRPCRLARAKGTVSRAWGGEEFCALLPDADLAGAQQAGQRMLEAVRQLPHPEAGNALQVTVSIGLAVAQGEGETVEDLLLRVDRALYAAKQAGRDRIVLAGPAESLAPV
jgi:diguanylate cyclase (GGDEF)-like protein